MSNITKISIQDFCSLLNTFRQFTQSVHDCMKKMLEINDDSVRQQPHYFRVLIPKEEQFNPRTDFRGGIDIASALAANNMDFKNVDFAQDYRMTMPKITKHACLCGDYNNYRVEFFPNTEIKVSEARAFISPSLILKTTIKSDESFIEYAQKHPELTQELIRKTYHATLYQHQMLGMCSQKEMDDFIIETEKENLQDKILSSRNIPFIQLIEKTKSFLFDILIENHATQIAADIKTAKQTLMSNKNNIYTWAEKFGYIQNAQHMTTFQIIRDMLAHPEENHFRLTSDTTDILMYFGVFINNLIRNHKIKLYFNHSQSFHAPSPSLSIEQLTNAYLFAEQLNSLKSIFRYFISTEQNEKKLKPRQQLEKLCVLGLISQNNINTIENATKIRNDLMHGRTNKEHPTRITNNHILLSNILNNAINYQENYISNN